MRALIVEDDPVTSGMLRRLFEDEQASVEETDRGEDAIDLARTYDFSVIVLDLRLPDMHGCQVIKRLRDARIGTPIIVLSGESDPDTKLKALFAGADDFITKPFDKRELIARQRAIVRRANGFADSQIRVGRMTLDINARTVWIGEERLSVTAKEYSILELLALRKGMTLTKETFLDHLYGGIDEPEQKIIDVFVCKLRKKISAVNEGSGLIETVWGHGYMIKDSGPDQGPGGRGMAEDAEPFMSIEVLDPQAARQAEVERLLLSLF